MFHGLQPREPEELQYENQHDEHDDLGKDMLAVDIELTQKILTSALERKQDNSLENMLAAKSGGKTVFDILCHGLENAAFHEWTHVLNKFLRLAWLKPLKSQGGRRRGLVQVSTNCHASGSIGIRWYQLGQVLLRLNYSDNLLTIDDA